MAEQFGAKRAQEALRDQAATVTEDLKELARTGKDTAREFVRGVKDKSRERIDTVRGDVQAYVELYPLKSLLIAAGVGLIVGALMTRRR